MLEKEEEPESVIETLTINLPLKSNITRLNIIKQLGDHIQEVVNNLIIKSNDCTIVEPPVFNGFKFTNITSLKIESPLQKVPENLFTELPMLKSLDLSKNQIKSIHSNTFQILTALENLDLSRFELNQILKYSNHFYN